MYSEIFNCKKKCVNVLPFSSLLLSLIKNKIHKNILVNTLPLDISVKPTPKLPKL